MAQAFDASGSGGNFSSVTERTWPHTVGAGSSRVLCVNFMTGTSVSVTAVKYGGSGGVSMTQIGTGNNTGGLIHYAYYLIDPSVGTADVYISLSGSDVCAGESASWNGGAENDATVIDANTTSSAETSNDNIAHTLTTVSDNSWVIMLAACEGGNIAASTNSTYRAGNPSTLSTQIYDSNGPITPAGTYTMRYTCGAGDVSNFLIALPLPGEATVSWLPVTQVATGPTSFYVAAGMTPPDKV
jgi:hypothetical protein